jgi:hypothetical protein
VTTRARILVCFVPLVIAGGLTLRPMWMLYTALWSGCILLAGMMWKLTASGQGRRR